MLDSREGQGLKSILDSKSDEKLVSGKLAVITWHLIYSNSEPRITISSRETACVHTQIDGVSADVVEGYLAFYR